MKKLINLFAWLFMLTAVIVAFYKLVDNKTDFLMTALSYVGWFFVACASLVALTWFGLGTWNFIRMQYLNWQEKRAKAKRRRAMNYNPYEI